MTHATRRHWPIVLLSLFVGIAFSAAACFFYIHSREVMQEQLRQRLESTAGSAALFISGNDLDAIHGLKDKTKPVFINLAMRLKSMRSLPNVRFAYIMRRTADPFKLEFVADADSLSTLSALDLNHDGIIESDEQASQPGDLYDITDVPALQHSAFLMPTSDTAVTQDQWGATISGYAPIRRSDGTVAGIIGIDMEATEYSLLAGSIFTPVALAVLIIMGLAIAAAIILLWERRQILILNRINKERSGLLKLTFHQLGEPLTIMKWSLETLRDNIDDPNLKKLVDEHVLCMDEGLGRLNSIIDILQQAEKIDLNTIEYLSVPSSLKNLFDNAEREWDSSMQKRKQTLKIVLKDDLFFTFDHNMLSLVLRQLLQNAIEYSPDGATITLRAVASAQKVTISVEDEGCGIPKADMPHMFEKYRRAANAPLVKPDGNGLGLYIAKGIVEKAGGTIWIESVQKKGTTVSFTLPMNS